MWYVVQLVVKKKKQKRIKRRQLYTLALQKLKQERIRYVFTGCAIPSSWLPVIDTLIFLDIFSPQFTTKFSILFTRTKSNPLPETEMDLGSVTSTCQGEPAKRTFQDQYQPYCKNANHRAQNLAYIFKKVRPKSILQSSTIIKLNWYHKI